MSSYDSKILSLYISFGFLIILGYGLLIKKYSKNKSLEIWNNKNKNMILKYKSIKYAYYINILLTLARTFSNEAGLTSEKQIRKTS